jgi:colanic acid biosynthesis glycosyl transferase WcaI
VNILLHGLNYSPEEIGIGKYSGEMVAELADRGHSWTVVTTPPYYPHWEIGNGFSGCYYQSESSPNIHVVRCPLWVPRKVNGWKRIVHLASFGISSIPVVLWQAIKRRPDVIVTVEPAAFCMPTTWLAAKLCGAKAWLHVQDFEVDAAFELGILKQPWLKKIVSAVEAFMMRRFDRVSSISPKMIERLSEKGVQPDRIRSFPNWVDCDSMRPLENARALRAQFGLPADKCIALYAGNVGAKQGLDLIVEAAKQSAHLTDLHFVICGHGAAYESIQNAAQGVANLQLLPVQPFEVFNALMNCADIHLLPQRGDAADLVMPSKLTGMLATGRPVVACASPGTQIAEVVQGRGLVVAPGDVDAFREAVVTLASQPEKSCEYGRQAREYAVQHLGKHAILAAFEAELEALRFRG